MAGHRRTRLRPCCVLQYQDLDCHLTFDKCGMVGSNCGLNVSFYLMCLFDIYFSRRYVFPLRFLLETYPVTNRAGNYSNLITQACDYLAKFVPKHVQAKIIILYFRQCRHPRVCNLSCLEASILSYIRIVRVLAGHYLLITKPLSSSL